MLAAFLFAVKSYSIPSVNIRRRDENKRSDSDNGIFPMRQVLLVVMCIIFGMEIGYKISTRKLLYLLHPCHVMTVVEVCVILQSLLQPYSYTGMYILHDIALLILYM